MAITVALHCGDQKPYTLSIQCGAAEVCKPLHVCESKVVSNPVTNVRFGLRSRSGLLPHQFQKSLSGASG